MKYLDREHEKQRILRATGRKKAALIIIYGRRRCGKSTLIKNTLRKGDIYFVAQQADEALQRAQLAKTIGEKISGFESLVYPDWESLFGNLNNIIKEPLTLCIDEFPYLVKSSPSLPGLLQKIIDNTPGRKYHLILCGSSQQMMQGMVLESSSPLYGRADEIIKVAPLSAGWITEALNCTPKQAVAEYAVWGGVPRYWELRSSEKTFRAALINIILDPLAPLHDEPARLFLDEMRESVQAYSILAVIGNGARRLSEIAARLNKPATQLARPLDNLMRQGYLKREMPFGEPLKNSKRGIYVISDPFMNFYFTFLVPNISRLELGLNDMVYKSIEPKLQGYTAAEWENLCRKAVPAKAIRGIEFDIASRWWGTNLNREMMEIDVVAESVDRKYLLAGECKWSEVNNPEMLLDEVRKKAELLPFAAGKEIIPVIFIKETSLEKIPKNVFLPSDVLKRVK